MSPPCRVFTLLLLAACREWPVCGNEPELTAADGEYGSVASGDYLVCSATLDPTEGCPDYDEVDAHALYEGAVGPTSDEGSVYDLRVDCGPETTREDACCYVVDVQWEIILVEGR